jgi:hypothetical protein
MLPMAGGFEPSGPAPVILVLRRISLCSFVNSVFEEPRSTFQISGIKNFIGNIHSVFLLLF